MKLCIPSQPQTKIDAYCNTNFSTDPDDNNDCNKNLLII